MSRMLPMLDPFDAIKQIYYSTTRETIERDMAKALDLLRQMPDDDARQRAAGLMHGLSDLKREWASKRKTKPTRARSAHRGAEAPPPHAVAKKKRPER